MGLVADDEREIRIIEVDRAVAGPDLVCWAPLSRLF